MSSQRLANPETTVDSAHVLFFAKWWNSWLEEDLEPVWPETYAAMPPSVQALMAGLQARAREEVFESAFDLRELNRGRFERRRREAEGHSSL